MVGHEKERALLMLTSLLLMNLPDPPAASASGAGSPALTGFLPIMGVGRAWWLLITIPKLMGF